jgi:hypothetical protein
MMDVPQRQSVDAYDKEFWSLLGVGWNERMTRCGELAGTGEEVAMLLFVHSPSQN